MTTTIDSAGRVVIPKSLRERAGLEAGTRIDFRFHDGVIEIVVATDPLEWERVPESQSVHGHATFWAAARMMLCN